MDVERYLERIGLTRAPALTREGLNQLISAHQQHIPFENLNICDLHSGVSLDEEHLFQKVIVDKRGGYCFELNGLFCAFLQELGFDASTVFVRLRDGGIHENISHRGILVRIDGLLHYADVGKGDLEPAAAIPLDQKKWAISDFMYWMEPDEKDSEWAWLMRQGNDGEGAKPYLRFSWVPRDRDEFDPYNKEMSESPHSPFLKKRMMTLRTERGFRTLRGDVYAEEEGGEVKVEKRLTCEEAPAILKDKFGIVLDA